MQYISPGVYIVENDYSDYVASLQETSVGMVGTAQKGPLNVPTLCTSTQQFLSIFGQPTPNMCGPYAALQYLQNGNQLWYNRVAANWTLQVTELSSNVTVGTTSVPLVSGAAFSAGDAVRISQDGQPTTVALIASVSTNTLTLSTSTPTIGAYTTGGATVDFATSTTAANQAEVFAYTRIAGTPVPTVKFTAINPGEWANFGSGKGIEIVIQDSGQFANVNPITGSPYTGSNGVPLQGSVTTAPSVDNRAELYGLTASQIAGVGEMRGVNYDAITLEISQVAAASGVATITVPFTTGIVATNSVTVNCSNTTFNGTFTVTSVTSTTITFALIGSVSTVGASGTVTLNNGVHFGVVYQCAGINPVFTAGITNSSTTVTLVTGTTTGLTIGAAVSGTGIPSMTTIATIVSPTSFTLSAAATATNAVASLTVTGIFWTPVGVLTKKVIVLYQGTQVEVFQNIIGYDATSPFYWNAVIGHATGTPVSNYIFAEYIGATGEQPCCTYNPNFPLNPRLLMGVSTSVQLSDLVAGTPTVFPNASGQDGSNPMSSDYIGTISSAGVYTGLQNFLQVSNYPIAMLCVPGMSAAAVVDEIITICETRNDCLGIIDPPLTLSVQEVVNWHNGTGTYTGLQSAFVTDKAALYYPWVKVFDAYSQLEIWLPPSAVIPGVIAHSDNVGEIWFAPAGVNRGVIPNAITIEYNANQGDMDLMYGPGNGNAINSIISLPDVGVVVWGQRTLQRTPSALDRINVRRMLFYVEATIAASVKSLVFEQDDPILWSRFVALVTPFLQSMVGQQAIDDFDVICDATTNTPAVINNNEMAAKIMIIPTKAAEKIVLNFTLLASGASFSEFVLTNPSTS